MAFRSVRLRTRPAVRASRPRRRRRRGGSGGRARRARGPGPDSRNVVRAGADQRLHALDPAHRARDLLDERGLQRLARRRRARRASSRRPGREGSTRRRRGRPRPSAPAPASSARCGRRPRPGASRRAMHPPPSASSISLTTPSSSPETTICVGELMFASVTMPAADACSHRAASLSASRPMTAAIAPGRSSPISPISRPRRRDELDPVLDRDGAGGRRGRVLAERVARDEVGLETARAGRVRDGERDAEEGRLRDLGARERLHRPFEHDLADRLARGSLGLAQVVREKVALALEQLGSHADLLRALTRIEEGCRHGAGEYVTIALTKPGRKNGSAGTNSAGRPEGRGDPGRQPPRRRRAHAAQPEDGRLHLGLHGRRHDPAPATGSRSTTTRTRRSSSTSAPGTLTADLDGEAQTVNGGRGALHPDRTSSTGCGTRATRRRSSSSTSARSRRGRTSGHVDTEERNP